MIEGDASFSFSISVVCFQGRHTSSHCEARHISVKSKLTEENNPSKIHTAVERRGKTFNDGPIHQNRPCTGVGRMRFASRVCATDGGWRDHPFLATFLRLEELKTSSTTFRYLLPFFFICSFFVKLFKEKHKKGSERCWFCGVVEPVRRQPRSTLALHVCYRQVQRRQKQVLCWLF